ncbi:MAG: NlpC/P60 family protein [Calditrichia bacterium]
MQTVFRLLNIELPRDSGPMSQTGTGIDIGNLANLAPADLVFFGKSIHRISHVGIYLGDARYIHSRGYVRINSFNPADPLYEDYLHSLFIKAMRILPD